jgi:galactokinase
VTVGADTRSNLDPDRLRARLDEVTGSDRRNAIGPPRIVRAPGRVNLIGEHTDYNEGFVLPAAIDLETRIAFVPTSDRRVELTLDSTGERAAFDLDAIGIRRGTWIDYVAGVARELLGVGATVHGLRGIVVGTLPVSAGLSSSAALELAAALALLDPPDPMAHQLDGMALARLAQRAENDFVGVDCGLMDQFACTLGRAGHALLLDCRSVAWRAVPLPLDELQLVVCHTGSARRLSASAYNDRRRQCERAVEIISEHHPAVRSLRDVDQRMLTDVGARLDDETIRRCTHVIAENERVQATVAALEAGDFDAVGRLWAASHASLRDLYEVSSAELDALVDIATKVDGVVAARMTGAGFGGSTVNLVRRDAVGRLRAAVEAEYPRLTRLSATVLPVEPADGAGYVGAE